jgi:hypothetical protein
VRYGLDAGGGDAEGEVDWVVEYCCGGGGFGYVAEDAGAETVFGVGCGVFVDGYLVGGAGVVEIWRLMGLVWGFGRGALSERMRKMTILHLFPCCGFFYFLQRHMG